MSLRTSAILCALALALHAGGAAAQPAPSPAPNPSPLDKPGKKDLVEPPAQLPKPPRGDRTRNLDFLFGALKAAPDDASAKHIEDRIWSLWLASGSDTCNLLMTRVKAAVDGENYDLAIRLLDAIIELRPKYVEAWNRRATVFFLKKDYGSAIADLRQVLTREPRHFGALSGLGTMLQDIGDDKDALAVYRRALAVHPRLNGIAEKVKTLIEKVEGRDI
jgi:tetratricopeptide (TPR) repeat protein